MKQSRSVGSLPVGEVHQYCRIEPAGTRRSTQLVRRYSGLSERHARKAPAITPRYPFRAINVTLSPTFARRLDENELRAGKRGAGFPSSPSLIHLTQPTDFALLKPQ